MKDNKPEGLSDGTRTVIAICCLLVFCVLAMVGLSMLMSYTDHKYGYDVIAPINVTVMDKNPNAYSIYASDGVEYKVYDFASIVNAVNSKSSNYISGYYLFNYMFKVNSTYSCTKSKAMGGNLLLSNCTEVK